MKECMTMQAKLFSAVQDLQAEAGRDPECWAWADAFWTKIRDMEKDLKTQESLHEGFINDFRIAAISGADMKTLKKIKGDQFLQQLHGATAAIQPVLQRLQKLVDEIKRMSSAKQGAQQDGASTSKKQRRSAT